MDKRFQLASFFKRLVAYLIDLLPIIFLVTMIAMQYFDFFSTMARMTNDKEDFEAIKTFNAESRIVSTISLAIWIIYGLIMDCSAQQGTYGKLIMGIKVVTMDGNPPSFEEAFTRNTCKVISATLMNLGFLWMVFDPLNQTWHDKIGRTFVVERKAVDASTLEGL